MRLQTTQCHHPNNRSNEFIPSAFGESEGSQQHAVKMDNRAIEAVPIDWILEDFQRVALHGQDEDASTA